MLQRVVGCNVQKNKYLTEGSGDRTITIEDVENAQALAGGKTTCNAKVDMLTGV